MKEKNQIPGLMVNKPLMQASLKINPILFAQNIAKLLNLIEQIASIVRSSGNTSRDEWMNGYIQKHLGRTGEEILDHIVHHPGQWTTAQFQASLGLIGNYWQDAIEMLAKGDFMSIATATDRRTSSEAWESDPAAKVLLKLHHDAWSWLSQVIEQQESLDIKTKRRAIFFLERILYAFNPANIAAVNPDIIEKVLSTNAGNLVEGAQMFIEDLQKGVSLMRPEHNKSGSFEIGKDLAVTKGSVVYENELFQLLHYKPTTSKNYSTPILIYPPFINKYYIIDLNSKKSMVKWLLDQGFSVFVVAWVNPDSSLIDYGLEEYIQKGYVPALEAVKTISNKQKVNVAGYCIGGTMLATWLSTMDDKSKKGINSVTFMTSQIDFSDAGELQVFVDDQQLDDVEKLASNDGIVPGWVLNTTFNMMRANDLIWPYLVANYLGGTTPPAFDILHWNSDYTSLTKKSYVEYIRNYYIGNKLARGELQICEKTADVSRITQPVYSVATYDDHIAPASSVYVGMQLLQGEVRMIVADSGHVAGVINPPAANKYGWCTAPINMDTSYKKWYENSKREKGSWWLDWKEWLIERSGKKVAALDPGLHKDYPILDDAPGAYVKVGENAS